MADARITIDGGIVSDPRWNQTPSGHRVGNLTVRAGRSRKNDQGGYDQLSSTPFDVACWDGVHDLLQAQNPEKGSQVTISGTVTDVRTYTNQQGETQASVSVNALGIKVWPKRQRNEYPGGQQGQPGQLAPQGGGFSGQGADDPWAGGNQGGYDDPPF